MNAIRLPRFKRAPEVAPMQLMQRDRGILQLVNNHRFLRSSQIVALLSESMQQVLRRLQLLFHHGFLERPRAQLDYFHHGGSRHIVYGIGNKGAALLSKEIGITSNKVHWGEKNRSAGRTFLEHALLVSDVMVAIEIACRENGRVKLLTHDQLLFPSEPGHLRQPFNWKVNISKELILGVIPDRVFALEYLDQVGNRDRAFCFLEADRGSMPVRRKNLTQTSFYRKLLAYEATWSQSIHRKRFGFHRFRVLTVTSSAERLRSLVEACSQLRSGHGLFLFTHRKSLAKPSDVFSPIWQTARQGGTASLLN